MIAHRKAATAALVITGLALSGCDPVAARRSSLPSDIAVREIPQGSTQCRCPGARRFRVVNNGSSATTVGFVRLERRLTSDDVTQISETRRIGGEGGEVLLQCSILESNGGDCLTGTRIAYRVNGIHYPETPENMVRETIVKLVSENLQTSDPLTSTGRCPKDCANTTSGRCVVVDATGSPDAGLAARVGDLVGTMPRSGTVPIKRILELTKGDANSCGRTDIATDNGMAHNYGDDRSCTINGTLPLNLGDANTVVPSNLLFRFDPGQSVGNFSLQFLRSRGAPVVRFSDPTLEAKLGGRLARADFIDGVVSGEFVTNAGANVCLGIRTR